jgi:hypothetical protein
MLPAITNPKTLSMLDAKDREAIENSAASYPNATVEELVTRVNVHTTKSTNNLIAAGLALDQLKARITNKARPDGAKWSWSFETFCNGDKARNIAPALKSCR